MKEFELRWNAHNHPTNPLKNLHLSKTPGEDLLAWYIREIWGPWTDEQMEKYQDRLRDIGQRADRLEMLKKHHPKYYFWNVRLRYENDK